MTPQKISLCIITGNVGAPMMNRFLDDFSQLADEIIVIRAIGQQLPDESLAIAAGRGCITGDYLNAPAHADWPHVDNFAAARNQAWSLATGDWVMWADTDDRLTPAAAQAIRRTVEEIKAHPSHWDCACPWFQITTEPPHRDTYSFPDMTDHG